MHWGRVVDSISSPLSGVVLGLALVALVGCDSKGASDPAKASSSSGGGDGTGDTDSDSDGGSGGSINSSGVVGTIGSGGSNGSGGSGSGTGTGGGAGAPSVGCYARVSHVSRPLEDPADGYHFTAFELTDDGAVGVLPGVGGEGYRAIEVDIEGEPQGEVQHLWQEQRAGEALQLAVSGDVLAVADLGREGDAQRGVCRLALADVDGLESIAEPTRVSDEPSGDTVLNEVMWCDVTRAGEGFLVAWQQIVSDVTDAFALYAQRVDADGNLVGDRLTLASGDKSVGQVALSSDGDEAMIAQLVDETTQITVVSPDDTRTLVVDAMVLQSPPSVLAVDDGLLLQAGDRLVLVDREGRQLAGPIDDAARLVAPLGDGYVVVDSEEYLVARTLDADLGRRSEASGISADRRAQASDLLFTPDGKRVAIVYSEAGDQRFATLECNPEPAPVGPQPCAEVATVDPLDVVCDDAICHVLVRLDADTLGLRGYAVVGGDENPIDASEALTAADEVFAPQGEGLVQNGEVSGPEAGLYSVYAEPTDFGAFALVSAESGLVVSAGGIIWAGTGSYWTPATWQPASDLACGSDAAEPDDSYVVEGACGLDSPSAALDVVLRSNLAAHLAEQGPFSAYGYLYTPTQGACDASVAEYLIVLTQRTD